MSNLLLFLGSFCSYLILFFVAVAVILLAVFIGILLRKGKNAKEARAAAAAAVTETGAEQ